MFKYFVFSPESFNCPRHTSLWSDRDLRKMLVSWSWFALFGLSKPLRIDLWLREGLDKLWLSWAKLKLSLVRAVNEVNSILAEVAVLVKLSLLVLVGGRVAQKKTKLMLFSTQLKFKLELELSLAKLEEVQKHVGNSLSCLWVCRYSLWRWKTTR